MVGIFCKNNLNYHYKSIIISLVVNVKLTPVRNLRKLLNKNLTCRENTSWKWNLEFILSDCTEIEV